MTAQAGLARQLLRTGGAAGRRAEAGRVRFWALLLATLFLSLAAVGAVIASASFDRAEERSRERSPRLVAAHPGEKAVALLQFDMDAVGELPYEITWLEPLTDRAPLPPGLPRWPAPGEVFVSQALLDAGGRAEARKYGELAGTIGTDGLEARSELLVYARPAAALLDKKAMTPISGFGERHGPGVIGQHGLYAGPTEFLSAYGALVLLPALVLAFAAARTGAVARDRRLALLTALGAGARHRAAFGTGEALAPVTAGAVLAAGLLAVPATVRLPLPVVDFVLLPADVRSAGVTAVAAWLASALVVLALAALLPPPRRRTRDGSARSRTWPLFVFPAAVLCAVRVVDLAPMEWIVPIYAVVYAVALLTLPSVLGALVRPLGTALAGAGRRTGRSGLLVAGRRMAASPQAAIRLTAGLVIALGLAVQAQVWNGSLTDAGQAVLDSRDRVGTSVLRVTPYDPERVRDFTSALPTGVHALAVRPESDGLQLTASCAALRETGLACRAGRTEGRDLDARLREFTYATGTRGTLTVRPADPAGLRGKYELLLVGDRHQQLDLTGLSALARRHLAMSADVEPVTGQYSLGTLEVSTAWLGLFTVAGVTLAFLAAAAGALAEFVRFGQALAPLSVLTANHRVQYAAACWSLLLPAVLAAGAGVLLAWWLAAPIRTVAPVGLTELAPLTAGALVCAVLLAVGGATVAVRSARHWQPSAR
ncbi:hypothetical protein [Streptomyces europaeiscabiei]|uniref:hypothetical protein n=1 Tax=Streptomyces europaeiscabiei TaxID=146819 RepID=UPI0038F72FE1